MKSPRILIAGLGNLLLKDDGVGVHAVRELKQAALPGVVVAEVGTAVLDALDLLEWAEKIVGIDAMQAGGSPGTVYVFGVEDVETGGIQTSLHELNLLAALRFLPAGMHPEIVIVGVEPHTIDYGLELSRPVAAALPQVIQAVREITGLWGCGRQPAAPGPQ